MKTLITGASGFIGSHVLDACLERGDTARVLVRKNSPGLDRIRKLQAETVYGDITDYASVRKACDGMDVVFHCAGCVTDWAPKEMFYDVNVGGMDNVCRACVDAGVDRLVWTSTCDVFGLREDTVINESLPFQKWGEPYTDSKIEAEEVAWKYFKETGLKISAVYPLWVYGARDTTFVPLLADAIIKKDMVFWRKGTIVWPTYVVNLVDLMLLISERDEAIGKGFLCHDGEITTLEDFCKGIADALGVKLHEKRLPYLVAYAAAYSMEKIWKLLGIKKRPLLTTYAVKNLGSMFKFSIHQAEDILGWKPRISHRDGFRETMDWLRTIDRSQLKQK